MEELAQLNAAQLALLGAVIAGATELITRLRAKDLWVAVTIVTSAVLGGLIGAYYGVDFVSGIAAGLGVSGTIKTISALGQKSTPAPSKDAVVEGE